MKNEVMRKSRDRSDPHPEWAREHLECINRCPVCHNISLENVMRADDENHGLVTNVTIQQCRDCRTGVTNPRPTRQSISSFYPDEYEQHNEADGDQSAESFMRRLLSPLRQCAGTVLTPPSRAEFTDATPRGRLLDVGCGQGEYLAQMAALGWDSHGLDISPRSVKLAASHPDVTASCEMIQGHEPRDKYDTITMWHSLEHLHDPVEALECVNDLLRAEGRLAIEIPNFESALATVFQADWYDLDVPRHLVHFTPGSIEQLCQRTGFRVEKIEYISAAHPLRETFRIAGSPVIPPRSVAWTLSAFLAERGLSSRFRVLATPDS